ncbi:MAG: prepilin peptidase, partial [Proteobacteria bacterium]|nr:prepilin peptidase [Pseudomonadota bacterium]
MTFDSLLLKFSNINLFFGFSVIIGSFIGSFLNVVILRLPEGTFLKHSRSVCPGCQKMIPIWLNIPIFGWIFLRGKARCCGMKISVQYPIVEFLTALMFGLSFMLFPYMSFNSTQYIFDLNQLIRFIHASLFVSIM